MDIPILKVYFEINVDAVTGVFERSYLLSKESHDITSKLAEAKMRLAKKRKCQSEHQVKVRTETEVEALRRLGALERSCNCHPANGHR
ncbi:hypothetical protein O5O45_26320 [Hahella aquimaris]|uniref:hypothetical protein n=1 Tax=Hahella sp. HNIBRBA332 TaxID=3015983 RepID=UPI00273A7E1B|nr:hypothetical protein [Hahella sp. HNIBRBA332]WLQ13250.1 hypothetical protein O5O45_26320 [Hahella sp. HNIBRBA332]